LPYGMYQKRGEQNKWDLKNSLPSVQLQCLVY
jgi:hypothetical protein